MDFEIKQVSSLERIFLDGKCTMNEIKCGKVCKGERISYQLAYKSDVTAEFSVEVESELAEYITLRSVGNVPSEIPIWSDHDDYYERTEPGLFPDVLYPVDDGKLSVKKQNWFSLWVTADIPEDISAGNYDIKITFKYEDFSVSKVFSVKVMDAVLPEQTLTYTQWFHADCISDYFNEPVFTERYWKILEGFMKTAVRTGINMILTPIFTPPLDTRIGGERTTVQLVDVSVTENGYKFGFRKLRRWIRLAKKCGYKYFEMAHLFSQWGAVAAPKIIADGKKIFGWETDASSDEYASFLRAFLPRLVRVLKEEKIADVTYFHVSDEPSAEQLGSYKAAKNIIKDILKDFPIIDALSEYEFYENGTVDFPIPCLNSADEFVQKGYEHHWTYYCCGQREKVSNRFFAMPLARTRIIGVQLYLYKMEGFLQWGYNFYNAHHSLRHINPYLVTDADGAFPSGDAFSVYPYNDTAIESIRSVAFYEGLQDMRALQLLESFAGRETVEALILKKFGKITFEDYPRGKEKMHELREFVNQMIEKYKGESENV